MYAESLAKNNKYDVSVFTSKEEGYENICPNGVNLIEGKSYPFLYNNFGIPQPIFTLNALKLLKEAVKNNDFIIINDRYYISSFFAYKYAKKFGKKIEIEKKKDAGILGGIIIGYDDVIIDGSMKRQLEMLKKKLIT